MSQVSTLTFLSSAAKSPSQKEVSFREEALLPWFLLKQNVVVP